VTKAAMLLFLDQHLKATKPGQLQKETLQAYRKGAVKQIDLLTK
jgi:hypothetical protein